MEAALTDKTLKDVINEALVEYLNNRDKERAEERRKEDDENTVEISDEIISDMEGGSNNGDPANEGRGNEAIQPEGHSTE